MEKRLDAGVVCINMTIKIKQPTITKLKITKKDLINPVLSTKTFEILSKSHETCQHFLFIYDTLNKNTKGKPTDKDKDLLRAMLVFSSSALDVCLKDLIRNNLQNCINKRDLSCINFNKFVKRNISKHISSGNSGINVNFLTEILAAERGRDLLIKKYIDDSISDSLQSKSKIIEISEIFGIKIEKDVSVKIEEYIDVFKVRNEIIHQMDVSKDTNKNNQWQRIQRRRDVLVKYTNMIFRLIEFFIFNINTMYKEDLNINTTNQ